MSHLVWGVLGVAVGLFFLIGAAFVAHPGWRMGLYGALFLGYGIYRLRQYWTRRAGEALPAERNLPQK